MPDRYLLDFEEPLRQIRQKISEIEDWEGHETEQSKSEIKHLEEQEAKLVDEIYSNLTNWQRVQIARHPNRPYTLDYIDMMLNDFVELHGDRGTGDDPAMVTGFAKLNDKPVAVIGQQKGRDNESRILRNFGMANPEGYRKALRIMKLAEKFSRPVITFVDTAGAFPGIIAEEHGQGEAIAKNLMEMSSLKVPIIVVIIGEGGSGGALGIGVGDRIIMIENSWYSVIAPESCSTILVKNTDKKDKFAEFLKLSAAELKKIGIVDDIIKEPLGGAHNNPEKVAKDLKMGLVKVLDELCSLPTDVLTKERYNKFMKMGRWSE
ncbi:acetyl-CoA carboxylase carboxyltransferase subunit alpha [Candidatus Latescibacterota bacterium]